MSADAGRPKPSTSGRETRAAHPRIRARTTLAATNDSADRSCQRLESILRVSNAIGADREGKDVEVTITGQMAIGMANGVMIAMEQNAQRSAAIAAGLKNGGEPEIRTIPESHFAH